MQLNQFGLKAWKFITTPIEDDATITILHGSVRSSKTFAMIPKLLNLVHSGPKGGLPLITGVTKETVYDNVLRDLFIILGEGNYSYNRNSGEVVINGLSIKVIGARDEGSEKYILGKTVPWAYGDEIAKMPETFFRQLINRLSVKGARFYGTTNPDTPTHYLYKDFIMNKELIDSGYVRAIHFNLNDNPNIGDDYKAFIRKAHSGVFYQRYVLGNWVQAEGAIYRDCWSDSLIYEDSEIPYGLYDSGNHDRWISSDYGTDHPHVYLDTIDDGITLWVVREYVWDSKKEFRQKTDSQYADDLQEFLKGDPSRNLSACEGYPTIVPPEAASFKAELRLRGIPIIEAKNDVLDGIRTVSSLMSLKRLRIHSSCTRLIDGIKNYIWDEKSSKRGEEKPLKQFDDETDALRYGIYTKIRPWRLLA